MLMCFTHFEIRRMSHLFPTFRSSATQKTALVALVSCAITCHADTFGASEKCSTALQDCPEGKKCRHDYDYWDLLEDQDGGAQQSGVCVPIVGHNRADEVCKDYPSHFSDGVHLDDCDIGLWCRSEGQDLGRCDDYCNQENQCSPGVRICQILSKSASICNDCNPIVQDCQQGHLCIYDKVSEHFICADAPLGSAARYAPCDRSDPAACGRGLYCSHNVPGCNSDGCCTPFCVNGSQGEESPCNEANSEACLSLATEIESRWIDGGYLGICVEYHVYDDL